MFIDSSVFYSMFMATNAFYSQYIVIAVMFVFLSIATYFDVKKMIIPNKLNLAFLVAWGLLLPLTGFHLNSIVGALLGFFIFLIPAMLKMHKMGGDIKCMTVIGLFLGGYVVMPFIALSCLIGLTYGIFSKYVLKKPGNMPFAPFFLIAHITLFVIFLIA